MPQAWVPSEERPGWGFAASFAQERNKHPQRSASSATHCDGRAYFDRRVAEDRTNKAALRALGRQISNTVYRHLVADAAIRRD